MATATYYIELRSNDEDGVDWISDGFEETEKPSAYKLRKWMREADCDKAVLFKMIDEYEMQSIIVVKKHK